MVPKRACRKESPVPSASPEGGNVPAKRMGPSPGKRKHLLPGAEVYPAKSLSEGIVAAKKERTRGLAARARRGRDHLFLNALGESSPSTDAERSRAGFLSEPRQGEKKNRTFKEDALCAVPGNFQWEKNRKKKGCSRSRGGETSP